MNGRMKDKYVKGRMKHKYVNGRMKDKYNKRQGSLVVPCSYRPESCYARENKADGVINVLLRYGHCHLYSGVPHQPPRRQCRPARVTTHQLTASSAITARLWQIIGRY